MGGCEADWLLGLRPRVLRLAFKELQGQGALGAGKN